VKIAKYRENEPFVESVGDALRQFQIFKEASKHAHEPSIEPKVAFVFCFVDEIDTETKGRCILP
jgi:hypothetical protein